jgi:hypothetical protein
LNLPAIEHCVQFPHGAHDDQVDAITRALLRWHQPVEQTTIIPFMIFPQRGHAAGKSHVGAH